MPKILDHHNLSLEAKSHEEAVQTLLSTMNLVETEQMLYIRKQIFNETDQANIVSLLDQYQGCILEEINALGEGHLVLKAKLQILLHSFTALIAYKLDFMKGFKAHLGEIVDYLDPENFLEEKEEFDKLCIAVALFIESLGVDDVTWASLSPRDSKSYKNNPWS